VNNTKKIVINNAIALLVYGLSVALTIRMSYNVIAIESRAFNLSTIGLYAAILCMLCGVFLFPIKKRTFLSILPVSVVFVIFVLAFLSLSSDIYAGFILFALNPFAMLFFYSHFEPPIVLLSFIFLLTPVLPSLFFYLGMLMRRLFRKLAKAA